MVNSVKLQFCVCFGSKDYSEWNDYNIEITDEELELYELAKKLRINPNEMPGLENVLSRAYDEIDVTEEHWFDENVEPDSDSIGLMIEFCDEDYEVLFQEEAEEILKELFAKADTDFSLVRLFIEYGENYYQGDTIEALSVLANKVAIEAGRGNDLCGIERFEVYEENSDAKKDEMKVIIRRGGFLSGGMEIEVSKLREVRWDNITGGVGRKLPYDSLFAYVPYALIIDSGVACSGRHAHYGNDAKVEIPKGINQDAKYRAGYEYLVKKANERSSKLLWR